MKVTAEVAEKITDMLAGRGIIPEEDAALYRYGIENGITVTGSLFASLLFGLVTGRLGNMEISWSFCSFTDRSGVSAEACTARAGQGVCVLPHPYSF